MVHARMAVICLHRMDALHGTGAHVTIQTCEKSDHPDNNRKGECVIRNENS